MNKFTIWIGLAMIALGVAAYVITSFASVTALIPAFFGVPITVLGAVALNPSRRRPAGIAALALGALGLLGILGRLVPTLIDGSFTLDAATIVQVLFALLALDLVVMWIMVLMRKRSNQTNG